MINLSNESWITLKSHIKALKLKASLDYKGHNHRDIVPVKYSVHVLKPEKTEIFVLVHNNIYVANSLKDSSYSIYQYLPDTNELTSVDSDKVVQGFFGNIEKIYESNF
jgi:hypothetical protein